MSLLLVAAGAAVGGPLRYLIDRAVQGRHQSAIPFGTLTVNLIASFVLGIVTAAAGATTPVAMLLGTGFCGALSTYSTFSYEIVRVSEIDGRRPSAVYAALSLVAGLACATSGVILGNLTT